ncbi:MAG: hypothetical protein ABI882_20445, partial [Acidobacteriota bacterium]
PEDLNQPDIVQAAERLAAGIAFGGMAALVLVSMGIWIGFARGATFDIPLSVATEVALLGFFWWEQQPERRSNFGWYACCFAIGLAVLAKGLVGIVLPGAVIVAYLLSTRRPGFFWHRRALLTTGALIFTATAATWYGPMFARHGRMFFNEFFVAHHFQRYLSDRYRHPQPFYFFFLVAIAGCLPWTAYLFTGIARDAGRLRELFANPEHRLRLFLWLWILIPIVFFSFSGSKLPGYILPVFPPIALLIALELTEQTSKRPFGALGRVLITALVLLLAAVGIIVWGGPELGLGRNESVALAASGALVAVGYLATRFRFDERKATTVLAVGVAAIVVLAVHLAFPGIARRESIRDLALTAGAVARPGERLIFYLDNNQGLNFYATSLPLRDARSELITLQHGDQIADVLKDRGLESLLVMCYQRWSSGLFINGRLETRLLATHSREIRCSPGCDWVLLRVSPGQTGRGMRPDER